MIDVNKVESEYSQLSSDIDNWIKDTYEQNFAYYFKDVIELNSRLGSEFKPITDEELEQILIDLPLKLFTVAEILNGFKAKLEAIKIEIKHKKHEYFQTIEEGSQTEKKEASSYHVIDDELLVKLYSTVIDRVEREISLSKELIMSSKKIWSARKQVEALGQVSENVNSLEELPEYNSMIGKEYIQ